MDYTNAPQILGQMAGLNHGLNQQFQSKAVAPDIDPFQELRNAQVRFHTACHQLQDASEERANAVRQLAEISAKCAQIIQLAMQDPTAPQQEQGGAVLGGMASNGQY